MEAALDYLYGREYAGRGLRPDGARRSSPARSTPRQPTLVDWLGEVRELFPRETVEVIEQHALDRYGLTELVTDPEMLERLEPSEQLLQDAAGAARASSNGEVLDDGAADHPRRSSRSCGAGSRSRCAGRWPGGCSQHRHSPLAVAANFDAARHRSARNLEALGPRAPAAGRSSDLLFFERNTRRLPWDVILCVDQSGCMVGSVIHSAVMAGILAGLPAFRVRLVVFDTNVVDLTDHVDDPVEVLMSVQLGGGTDIAQARALLRASWSRTPQRTVLVLVTDFCEGAPPGELVAAVRGSPRPASRCSGWPRSTARPTRSTTGEMAQRLADCGMEIAALTPAQLASWLAEVTS